ncbi:MAG: HAD family hydrolase [Planctomycetota bacterium]
MQLTRRFVLSWLALVCLTSLSVAQQALPSWNDGKTRQAIEAFVERVTTPGSPDFVPESDRIAVFDNDGTLWSEQPMYVQLAFILDRVKALAPEHPEWKEQPPFNAVLNGDLKALGAAGERGLMELLLATHAGMTSEEFEKVVKDWIASAKHPRYQRPYTECVYQPMRELLDYLRAHQFKTYIVSGGGVELMRPWAEEVYGIPPEQVIGSSIKLKYELREGRPVLVRLPEIDFIDDKAGKPVGIHRQIGRRPIFAAGNSDGDFEMLEYTTAGAGPRFALILHHTDSQREAAYDRQSHFGKLDKALDAAAQRGWTVIDMQQDWKQVFPNK